MDIPKPLARRSASLTSPVFYIVVSMMLTSAMLALVFYMAWRHFGREPHALTWSFTFLAGAAAWFLALYSAWSGKHNIYLLGTNAMSLVMVTLALRGHCQRTNCGILPASLWPYAMAIYMLIPWAVLVEPNMGLATAVAPATACVSLLLSALITIRHREETRPAEWAAAIAMLIFGVSRGIAAVLAFLQGPNGDEVYSALFTHYNFLTLPAGYVGMSLFIVLMLASDLSVRLREIAVRDELTGLLNRRGFVQDGERAFALAKRTGAPLSIIMADIDRFKYINDEYGHAAGDTALQHFAELISRSRRAEDIVARVGGEEFALILPGVGLRDAMAIADQLCASVGDTPMRGTGYHLPMTSSFGVATISEKDRFLDNMVVRADRALYRSKRAGRNQVDLESSQLMLAADGTLQPVPKD